MRRTFFVTQRHRTSVPRRLAAVMHTFSLVMLFAASSAPTPLYRIYQASWGFSPVMLTVVFGAYALALLAALLTAGSLSDFLGRRPVIMLALLLAATSMGLFLLAVGPHWLIAARLVQGLATGIATTALSAALLDLNHQRGALINSIAPMAGMAIGAMGSSALLILAPAPLHLVFVILLVAFAICLAMTWWTPETGGGRPGALASLRPSISIPPHARIALLAISPVNIAVWMLGGVFIAHAVAYRARHGGAITLVER
ncbi:hypothetical protein NVIRENTERO_00953 [Sodalis praecaptivus]|nr:hypothetical protein NVIRENTERO_00953 [Sodalis praecaptivus]